MKTTSLLSILFVIAFSSNHLFATDRVVQMSGPVGTYASIGAAITAAVDGDIIIINNRLDGLPWQENLTIAKSLTFVSAVDNVQWWMEGTISITMAEGRSIMIAGMRNSLTTGHITKTGSVPVNRTVLNIVGSDIAGNLSVISGVNLYLGSSKVNSVDFSYGKVIGNEIVRTLTCGGDVATEDVNLVIGNKIGNTTMSNYGYYHYNSSQYLYFANNFVRGSAVSNYASVLIQSVKNGTTVNRIANNTITSSYTGNISLNIAALNLNYFGSGQLTVENNIICGHFNTSTTGTHGVYITSGSTATANFYFNMYNNPFSGATTLSTSLGNFTSALAIYANISTDGVITGTAHVNLGNTSNAYLDLDLSRNDIGCYGGSYSLTNFLPMMNNPESSRLNYVNAQRIIPQGGTVNVQAIGYDK